MSLVSATFDRSHGKYNIGQHAGLPASELATLAQLGVAHMTTPEEMKAYDEGLKAKEKKGPAPLVAVKFTRSWRSWNVGHVAGFPESVARVLVEQSGVAIYTKDGEYKPPRTRKEILKSRLFAAEGEKKKRRPVAKKSPIDREAVVEKTG